MGTEIKAAAIAAALGAFAGGAPGVRRGRLLWEPNSDRTPEHTWCRWRARPGRRR